MKECWLHDSNTKMKANFANHKGHLQATERKQLKTMIRKTRRVTVRNTEENS